MFASCYLLEMDEAAKGRFKWKFYRLTIVLNVIVLLIALAVIAYFRAPPAWNLPLVAALLVPAVLLAWYFRKEYRRTKAWLDAQP